MQPIYILMVGRAEARTAFLSVLLDLPETQVQHYNYGRFVSNDGLPVYLFSGANYQTSIIGYWNGLDYGMGYYVVSLQDPFVPHLGGIVLVEVDKPETYRECRTHWMYLRYNLGDAPTVVMAKLPRTADAMSIEDIRTAVKLDDGIPIFPFIADDRTSAVQAMWKLLDLIQESMDD
ncbi:MAG: hypothetical protein IT324_28555 [Anaerolineae bacterium]|nr:hypothetical protein [Anaerolineae bacterium]